MKEGNMEKENDKERITSNKMARLLSDVVCPIALFIYACLMASPSLTSLFSTAVMLHGKYKLMNL
jgi:hypothetical protein